MILFRTAYLFLNKAINANLVMQQAGIVCCIIFIRMSILICQKIKNNK